MCVLRKGTLRFRTLGHAYTPVENRLNEKQESSTANQLGSPETAGANGRFKLGLVLGKTCAHTAVVHLAGVDEVFVLVSLLGGRVLPPVLVEGSHAFARLASPRLDCLAFCPAPATGACCVGRTERDGTVRGAVPRCLWTGWCSLPALALCCGGDTHGDAKRAFPKKGVV